MTEREKAERDRELYGTGFLRVSFCGETRIPMDEMVVLTKEPQAELPKIAWVKNAPKYNWFEDGSKFLVALKVRSEKTKTESWEFAVVITDCDGDGMSLRYEGGDYCDAWSWTDFEYFHLLDGKMPVDGPGEGA